MNELYETLLSNNFSIKDSGLYFTYPSLLNIHYETPIYHYYYYQDIFNVEYLYGNKIIRYFDAFLQHIEFDFYLLDNNEIDFIDLPPNYDINNKTDIPNSVKNGFKLIINDINIYLPVLNAMKVLSNIQ